MSCEFFKESQIKSTKKIHRCFGCGTIIEKGKPARYESGKFDGEFYDGYFCEDCQKIKDECPRFRELAKDGYCEDDILENCLNCNESATCTIIHPLALETEE